MGGCRATRSSDDGRDGGGLCGQLCEEEGGKNGKMKRGGGVIYHECQAINRCGVLATMWEAGWVITGGQLSFGREKSW